MSTSFPWPSDGQRRAAAQCIRDEYAYRNEHRRQISEDLFGHPGVAIASVPDPTPEDIVDIVLWSLRGDRRPRESAASAPKGRP